MTYISVPITTSRFELEERAYEIIRDTFPDFQPNPGGLLTILIQSIAMMAETRAIESAEMPARAFRYFGEDVLAIPRADGVQARLATTWTLGDTDGHTIPAGTFVIVDEQDFQVSEDVVVAPGAAVTGVGQVELIALESGTEYNGLGSEVILNDALTWVESIAAEGLSIDGEDVQDDEAYLDYLAGRLQLLADRLIVPEDFEAATRTVAGVGRVAVLDGYNPADGTSNNERMVTVAVASVEGTALSSGLMDEVDAYLQSRREVNFEVHVIGPTTSGNTVTVTFNFKSLDGYSDASAKANAEQAVADYLNPATFGKPLSAESDKWITTDKIRINKIVQALENSDGIDYVENVRINGSTSDFTLSGPAPLPSLTSATGTAL